MSLAGNPERVVQAFLDEGATVLGSHVHATIAEDIRRIHQRDRARPWRNVRMPSRLLVLWPAGLLVLVVGIAVGAGMNEPVPTDTTPSVAPAVTWAPPSPDPVPSTPPASAPTGLVADADEWLLHETPDDHVRAVRVDGTGGHPVLADNGIRQLGPAWDPDGHRVAFEAGFGFASQIWIADADGSNAVPLTDLDDRCAPLCQYASDPAWSGDGRSIAYVRTSVDAARFAGNELVVIDVATRSSRVLLSDATNLLRSPSWEPHSTRIVLGINTPGDDRAAPPVESRIVVLDADATTPDAEDVPGTTDDAGDPDWGVNGLITYVSNGVRDGRRLDPDRGSALLVVDPDSGVGLELVRYPAGGAVPVTPAWASDGKSVVFGRISANASVPVIRSIQLESRDEASATGETTTVGWAPDVRPPSTGGQ